MLAAKTEEKIRLVLLGIETLAKNRVALHSGSRMLHRGVVTGCDVSGTQGGCLVPEIPEFEFLVAHDTRIRGASGLVLFGEVIDDQTLEWDSLIDHVMGNPQCVGDAACVGDRLRAAAFVLGPGHAVLGPELHGDTDDLPPLLFQKPSGHARVNATAHPNDNASGISKGSRCAHEGMGSLLESEKLTLP